MRNLALKQMEAVLMHRFPGALSTYLMVMLSQADDDAMYDEFLRKLLLRRIHRICTDDNHVDTVCGKVPTTQTLFQIVLFVESHPKTT